MGIPFSFAVAAIFSASLVDAFWLSRLGTNALAAMGFCGPVLFLINSANIGLGAGTASVISRALGEKREGRAKRYSSAAAILGLLIMALAGLAGFFLLEQIFSLMSAPEEVMPYIRRYMVVAFPGLLSFALPIWANMVLRSLGQAIGPTLLLLTSAILNLILDPIFIFGLGPVPAYGMTGAALATVTANILASALGCYLVWRERFLSTEFRRGTFRRAWMEIARIGVPAAGTNLINPLAIAVATALFATELDKAAVAGFYLAASGIGRFSIAPMLALSGAIGPVVGQNGGARDTARVRSAFIGAFRICIVWSVLIALILGPLATTIPSLFDDDPGVVSTARAFFLIVPITLAGYGWVICSSAGLNALGRPLPGVWLTLVRSFLLYVPLLWVGLKLGGAQGAFIGVAVANILAALVAGYWILRRADLTAIGVHGEDEPMEVHT